MLEKVNRMNELYDAYQELLTTKQKVYFELYYQDDLSLSEIAEQFEVSRNAVFDNIKRTEKLLEDYEDKLQLLDKREAREKIIDQIILYTSDEQLLKWMNELQSID
ncbi:MAG: putative DNA-binding protein [Turicibacter sp.]|nr:putative DNA-binding protein [Turicibacter sp.]MBQ1785945.1 putative DNA-binding protein [Turicibacter sp.]MEE0880572.1 putative DNA-binding protein [Turicibacter sp.]